MRHGPLRTGDVLAWQPGAQLHRAGDGFMGLGGDGQFLCLEEVDPEGVSAVLAQIDGARTVGAIVSSLEKQFAGDDVVALVELLLDSVLRVVVDATVDRPRPTRVAVIGSGELARAVLVELRLEPAFDAAGYATMDGVSEVDVVVCALEDVHGRLIMEANEACLRLGVPTLFAVIEGPDAVVGPLNVPGRTPCFSCSRLSTTLRPKFDSGAADVVPLLHFGAVDARGRWLAVRAAAEVRAELERVRGSGYPKRLGSALRVGPSGERTEVVMAVTSCPLCRGHHRGRLDDASATTSDTRLAREVSQVVDSTGGTRSITALDAVGRAEAAAKMLGVELDCRPLPAAAPERLLAIGCPYFHVVAAPSFSPDAPVLFPSLVETCFGKGTTEQQARCSAMFEWFERNLAGWTGDRDILRASYADVRERAIDMPFLASGLLDGMPLEQTRAYSDDETIDWVWGHCLRRDRPILVPAALVYLSGALFLGHGLQLPSPGSSGLSAGCTLGDATLQGLLEIIERDAHHTALRNGLECPVIDHESIADEQSRTLLERMAAAGYTPQLRDITSAFGVPVVELQIVCDDEYIHHHQVGYGAHLDPAVATRRAITEAAQSLFFDTSVGTAGLKTSSANRFDVYPYRKQAFERRAGRRRADERKPLGQPGASAWDHVDTIVERVASIMPEGDVCIVDLTPPVFRGVHVVRVIASGMLDAASEIQLHVPRRCRLVPFSDMFLGRLPG